MDTRVRRALRVALPLLVWAGLVSLAVLQGRALRDDSTATGSWVVLVACSLGAVAALYAALVGLLRSRVEADRARLPPPPPPAPPKNRPRHRA